MSTKVNKEAEVTCDQVINELLVGIRKATTAAAKRVAIDNYAVFMGAVNQTTTANLCNQCTESCVITPDLTEDYISGAFNVLQRAMEDTSKGGLAHSWHSNIAMACFDAIMSDTVFLNASLGEVEDIKHVANEAASRFMLQCFKVVTAA